MLSRGAPARGASAPRVVLGARSGAAAVATAALLAVIGITASGTRHAQVPESLLAAVPVAAKRLPEKSAVTSAIKAIHQRLGEDKLAAAALARLATDEAMLESARANVFADRKGIEQIVNDFGFAGGPQLSSERLSTQILRFSGDRKQKPTHADNAAQEAAQKEAYNLGLPARTYGTFRSADEAKRIEKRLENSAAAAGPGKKNHPSKICIPPTVYSKLEDRCIEDPRVDDLPPRGCNSDNPSTEACRKWAADHREHMKGYLNAAREANIKERKKSTKPDFVYKGMTAKAAQAIFSIKPHHYPQETRKLGDNFLEGFADDKPVKKLFSDMIVDAGVPRSRDPFGGPAGAGAYGTPGAYDHGRGVSGGRFGNNGTPGSGQNGRGGGGGSPYELGYVNPYIRDSGRPGTFQRGRGSPLDASRGLHGPYNPRLTRGGGLPRYPKDLRRAIRELDVGAFESRDRDPFAGPGVPHKHFPHGHLPSKGLLKARMGNRPMGKHGVSPGMGRKALGGNKPGGRKGVFGKPTGHSALGNSPRDGHPQHEIPPQDMGKRELERLGRHLRKEIPKISDMDDKKDAEKELKEVERQLDKRIKSNLNGGNGLLGMTDSFKAPIQVAKQFHPREDFMSPASSEVKGVIPKTQVPQWKKLQDKLDDTKKDLLDAEEDKEEAEGDGVDPATVQDDGKLGMKEGLMLPEAIQKYKQKADELRKEIAKIPKVFGDVGPNPAFFNEFEGKPKAGAKIGESWDDVIPEAVVNGVYKNQYKARPEGEPISDFMNNGWNGLNLVADP